MNRRSLLGGLAALIPLGVRAQDVQGDVIGGRGAIWRQKVVHVEVFTDPRWHPFIKQSFADMKRMSGKRLPKFQIRYNEQRECAPDMRSEFPEGTMIWCSHPTIWGAAAWTGTNPKDRGLAFVKIVLSNQPLLTNSHDYNQNTTCHELMHGITWVNDHYNADLESCVHGDLPHPGKHDKKLIQRMYRKNRERK